MAKKQAFSNSKQADFGSILNWGLKVTDFSELFIVTGHGDLGPDLAAKYPGDPVAQTRYILSQMQSVLEQAGYTVNDIIRTEWTLTTAVTDEQLQEIIAVWESFLATVAVKPAAGTLRFVERLVSPEMLVEYELLLAR